LIEWSFNSYQFVNRNEVGQSKKPLPHLGITV